MSFDSLPYENDKDLFKYIACFFVGVERDFAETILSACDINTSIGISRLFDRCLLCIGCNGELTMHSLIQEMGRDVVDKESPNHPEKRTRVWRSEDSFKVLKKKKGTDILKGLALDMRILEKEKFRGSFELKTDALSSMENLMILHLNYVQLNGSYENFPDELRWLCMHGFPLKSIPSDLPMTKLVSLDMSYSNIESFGISYRNRQPLRMSYNNIELFGISYKNRQLLDNKKSLIGSRSKYKSLLGSLKILNLSYCYQLRILGGFREFPSLEKLSLTGCTSLIDICESIELCGELVLIDLSYCKKFKKFAKTIDKLKTVKTLILNGCNPGAYEIIPRNLNSLAISLPRSLVSLSFANNNLFDETFPMEWSNLSMLKELFLDEDPTVSVPSCVTRLARLEYFSMEHCKMLMPIEQPPPTLRVVSYAFTHSKSGVIKFVRPNSTHRFDDMQIVYFLA